MDFATKIANKKILIEKEKTLGLAKLEVEEAEQFLKYMKKTKQNKLKLKIQTNLLKIKKLQVLNEELNIQYHKETYLSGSS